MNELMKSLLSAKMKAFEDAYSDDGRIYTVSINKYNELLSAQNKYSDRDVFNAYMARELLS